MSWSPGFNFRLRDDETEFGGLIFNNSMVQNISDILMQIRDTGNGDMGQLHELLIAGCKSNEELTQMKMEIHEIKEDLKEFNSYNSGWSTKFNNFLDKTQIGFDYAVGSATWMDKYADLKQLATEMFFRLLETGVLDDNPNLEAWHKRYDEVEQSTTSYERLGNQLRKEYRRNVVNGVPEAADIYYGQMLELGYMSEQEVEKARKKDIISKLLSDAESNETKEEVARTAGFHKTTDDKVNEETSSSEDTGVYEAVVDDGDEFNGQTVTVTADLMTELGNCVRNKSNDCEALYTYSRLMYHVFKECGVEDLPCAENTIEELHGYGDVSGLNDLVNDFLQALTYQNQNKINSEMMEVDLKTVESLRGLSRVSTAKSAVDKPSLGFTHSDIVNLKNMGSTEQKYNEACRIYNIGYNNTAGSWNSVVTNLFNKLYALILKIKELINSGNNTECDKSLEEFCEVADDLVAAA